MIGASKSGTKMSQNSVKENVIHKEWRQFGDKKGNSPNSVMNSSLAGIGHIYGEKCLYVNVHFQQAEHRESKCPKRHFGWWRRHGLTIFKNKKLLTSYLTH